MFVSGELTEALFLERPNRFLIRLSLNGEVIDCHMPNPGRMKEFLTKNKRFLVRKSDNPKRKTKYTAIGVYHKGMLVSLDTGVPNKLAHEAIQAGALLELGGYDSIRPEVRFKSSRLDFLLERPGEKCYIEVKSCTLVEKGIALFPDAPTTRGQKHLMELIELKERGNRAVVLFVIGRKDSRLFKPNVRTDPEFGRLLKEGDKKGVEILAYDSTFDGREIKILNKVEIALD